MFARPQNGSDDCLCIEQAPKVPPLKLECKQEKKRIIRTKNKSFIHCENKGI